MRAPILVQYPRELALSAAVAIDINAEDAMSTGENAVSLARAIRDHGAQPIGPLIQRTRPGVEGNVQTLLRQCTSPVAPGGDYEALPAMKLSGCVMAQFEGAAIDVGIVFSAIDLYAYENEIDLTGEVHLVFVRQHEMDMRVDVFASAVMPLDSRAE